MAMEWPTPLKTTPYMECLNRHADVIAAVIIFLK